jgi:hypothetical protein
MIRTRSLAFVLALGGLSQSPAWADRGGGHDDPTQAADVPSSSPEFEKAYLETLDTAHVPYRPELRWLVDPGDFLRPQVFDPDDRRWSTADSARRVSELCDRDRH